MIQIEAELLNKFNLTLEKNGIPRNQCSYYLKWLRYYLDFCHKYNFEKMDFKSLPLFIDILRSKKQNEDQMKQAARAVQFFYSLSKANVIPESVSEKSQIKEHRLPYNTKIKQETSPAQVGNNNLKPIMTSVPFRSFWGTVISERP